MQNEPTNPHKTPGVRWTRYALPLHETGEDAGPLGHSAVMVAVGLILNVLFLAIDLARPDQFATAVLYAVPVLAAFWMPSPRATLIIAITGSVCSAVGYAMTPVVPAPGPGATLVFRAAALSVLWGTAVIAIRHQIGRTVAEQSTISSRHKSALLEAILDTAPDALVVIDAGGVIRSFSRSAELMFGHQAEDVIGKNVNVLMPSGDREAHGGYLERYLRTGERRIIGIGRVVEGETKDGRKLPVELSVGEARVANHRVFIGFMRDLSARRRIEDELRQAQKMEAIGQLTGGIAHDFNNLLLVIAGNLELIEAHPERPDPVALKEAQEAVDLGAKLTAQLLAFGRKQPLEPREIDVVGLVTDVASMLRRTLGDDIEVDVEVRGTPARAVVDAAQLQTSLINLAINARDAMRGGGHVSVAVFETELDASYARNYPEVRIGRFVAVQVSDNGSGMSEEVRERACEPFFTTKPSGAGNGLGLSMVYGFAKQSGGHMEIDSAIGRGTTVTLFLPRASSDGRPDIAPEQAVAAAATRGETILVVEDDPPVRRVAMARLRELGYHALEASSGPDALRRLGAAGRVDLLFTDIVLKEGMSGLELARHARAAVPHLRLLFSTGYADPDIVVRDGSAGIPANLILRKPYGRQELAIAIRAVLDAPSDPARGEGVPQ